MDSSARDIIERLRAHPTHPEWESPRICILCDAAEEIARLRAPEDSGEVAGEASREEVARMCFDFTHRYHDWTLLSETVRESWRGLADRILALPAPRSGHGP